MTQLSQMRLKTMVGLFLLMENTMILIVKGANVAFFDSYYAKTSPTLKVGNWTQILDFAFWFCANGSKSKK